MGEMEMIGAGIACGRVGGGGGLGEGVRVGDSRVGDSRGGDSG